MTVFINRLSTTTRFAAFVAGGLLTGILALAPATGSAQQAVAVVVNGQTMSFDQPPIVQAGRVFVPLRSIFQQLGASVVYANGQINATGRGRTVALTIGSTQATVSGQPVTLDVAPFVVGSRTLVPLRFVAQSLGASVSWNDADSTVTIRSGNGGGYRVSNANANQNYNTNYVSEAPPELPQYDQPYAPAPNYIWTPGYWAWSGSGYYWVPGTWAQPPQTGLYWTPGYWGENPNGSGFAWNAGYWAPQVGFYGGINYGYGYFGNGYQGGRWGPQGFAYNTAYSNVNRTIITNTYINRTVTTTTVINRVSYNGRGGAQARATAQQVAAAKERRAMTAEQVKHAQAAAQDRDNYANVNHGKPAVPAVSKPLTAPPAAPKPAQP
ncbi:MAG TPA: stalk domain-containing protein, partial [Candidatus Acidoferrales bacterium]|nr:stalk domain-containing protein [Candidatus Acidoferrales bacterium]